MLLPTTGSAVAHAPTRSIWLGLPAAGRSSSDPPACGAAPQHPATLRRTPPVQPGPRSFRHRPRTGRKAGSVTPASTPIRHTPPWVVLVAADPAPIAQPPARPPLGYVSRFKRRRWLWLPLVRPRPIERAAQRSAFAPRRSDPAPLSPVGVTTGGARGSTASELVPENWTACQGVFLHDWRTKT